MQTSIRISSVTNLAHRKTERFKWKRKGMERKNEEEKKIISNEKWVGIDQRSMSFHQNRNPVIDFIYSDFGRLLFILILNACDNDTVCKCILLGMLWMERENEWMSVRNLLWLMVSNERSEKRIFYNWWWCCCAQMEGTICHELSRFNKFYLSDIYSIPTYLPINLCTNVPISILIVIDY